jgi:hypothetical protein
VCRSANPASIRARMSRRESVFDDDFVAVHLDPFREQRLPVLLEPDRHPGRRRDE